MTISLLLPADTGAAEAIIGAMMAIMPEDTMAEATASMAGTGEEVTIIIPLQAMVMGMAMALIIPVMEAMDTADMAAMADMAMAACFVRVVVLGSAFNYGKPDSAAALLRRGFNMSIVKLFILLYNYLCGSLLRCIGGR